LFSKNIVVFICGLLSSIVVARHLGPDIYGKYIFVMLVISYFVNFGRFRLSKSILPYLKIYPDHELEIFSLGLFYNFCSALVTIILLNIIGIAFNIFKDISIWIYPVVSAFIVAEHFMFFLTYNLSFYGKFKSFALLSTFKVLIQTIGFVYLYFFSNFGKNILPYLFINAGTSIIAVIIGSQQIRVSLKKLYLSTKKINMRYYFKISLLFYVTDIFNFFNKKIVATVVAGKLALSNLAFFNMMFTHFNLLMFPNKALGTIMYPFLSKERSDIKQRKYILKKVLINLVIYPPILLAAYMLYPKLVILFYGSDYKIITEYFPYILVFGAPYLIAYPVIHYFSANGAPQYEGIMKILSIVIQILFIVYFISLGNFSLLQATISQALGLLGFTVALITIFYVKRFKFE